MAVTLWSPVIITVRIPARRAFWTAARDSLLGGSIMAVMPKKIRSCSTSLPGTVLCRAVWPCCSVTPEDVPASTGIPLCDGLHAKASTRSPWEDHFMFWSRILRRSWSVMVRCAKEAPARPDGGTADWVLPGFAICVQRSRSTSRAPFTNIISPSSSRFRVDISFLLGSKGSSPVLGQL